ncbi:hypothetical protein CBF16_22710 (plasmid) [Pantoea agglomerans]|uniref:hypothetical protein n=1 Tax=Enterobacter agglomerans TaxID=549 RepID=UPI000F5EC8F4|nr:hypothetical protein [Pantoea agglomerans]AZI53692.1 hypothetical protein CBF16_22710 [Pantoea agglomerans]
MSNINQLILYRMMKADTNHRPALPSSATDRDCLSVRYKHLSQQSERNPKVDVYIDDNGIVTVQHQGKYQGLSLTIPPVTNIPPFMLDPVRGLVRFTINPTYFAKHDHLMYVEDSAVHAMIVPRYDMPIHDFNRYLADTGPMWEVDDDDE